MNNTRTRPSDPGPVEQIDAILLKYSAWASSHAAEAPAPNGIREVTYSSALSASNPRRKLNSGPTPPPPRPAAPAKPARRPRRPGTSSSSGKQPDRPKPSRRNPARPAAGIHAIAPASPTCVLQPSSNRVVSLSVRLAAEECALVRLRAAEARLSISAYLRQCVLDVDAMRMFVDKISAELQATASAPHAAFAPALLSAHAAIAHSTLVRPMLPGILARPFAAIRRLFSR